jgi:prepilin-type N-terminal cleavage/methylation domain-containing protein
VKRAFSLVEVLAAVAIIGIITFLAIPNIIRIKSDGEQSLAISRAEALNMAMASYLQAKGSSTATSQWSSLSADSDKYAALTPYIAFAPAYTNYMPSGYTVSFTTLTEKTKLYTSGSTQINY